MTQDDGWQTQSADLQERTLDELLLQLGGQSDREDVKTASIGYRSMPAGLRGICDILALEYKVSYALFVRTAVAHGAAILARDPALQNMTESLRRTRRQAMKTGDLEALSKMVNKHPFTFMHGQPEKSSVSVDEWTKGLLHDLRDKCGVDLYVIAGIALMKSLLTLPKGNGYRKMLREEVNHFERAMRDRLAGLTRTLEGE